MIGIVQKIYESSQKSYDARPIPASLFYNENISLGIEGLYFDLFISEEFEAKYSKSSHSLQSGVVISDHVRKEPFSIPIKGLFTNHPISYKLNNERKIEIEKINLSQKIENRALSSFNKLKELADKMEPVKLITSLHSFDEMIITNIKASRDEESKDSILFSVLLEEIKVINLSQINVDYNFYDKSYVAPKDMKNDSSKLTAEKKNSGNISVEEKSVNEITKQLNARFIK